MSGWAFWMLATAALGGASRAGLVVPPSVLQAEADRIAVIARAKHSVLAVFSASGAGGGSGVLISPDGYALTNFHVAQPCGYAMKCGLPDGRLYDAVLVGIDPVGDVALIKLFGRDDFPYAEWGDSDRVQVGDPCLAMGNPFLLASDFHPTVTHGIVSGVHRYQHPAGTLLEYTDCLQTDASINPGNSGGPLFDAQGRLIGINGRASFDKRGRVNVGIAYAISINQIKNFLGHLKSGRVVDHATLGAVVAADEHRRVLVADILEHSDAYRRGLRYGDEILSLGGRSVDSPNAFKNVLGTFPKGWRVPLSYRREGKRYDVLVRLAGVHSEEELWNKVSGQAQAIPMPIPKPGEQPPAKGRKPSRSGRPNRPEPEDPTPPIPPLPPDDHPISPLPPKLPLSEVVLRHYEPKRGYANYWFNRMHRDRVWKAWMARGDLTGPKGPWTLAGPLESGGTFRIVISDSDIVLEVPAGRSQWKATDELTSSLAPEGSGGLFAALWLWRRLAVAGPELFGEVSYLGTVPVPGQPELADALVGLYGGVECHFLFDPKSGRLLALEMFPAENTDPCEVRFLDYRPSAGAERPHQIEVRHGDLVFARFRVEQFVTSLSNQP